MTDWHESYKRRLAATGGSVSGAMSNSTKHFVNDKFFNHPSFTYANIDGSEVGVRVLSGNRSNIKKLLFYSEAEIPFGEYAIIDEKTWLITDLLEDEPSGLFPSAEIKLCNNTLTWTDDEITYDFPCVIENTVSGYPLSS